MTEAAARPRLISIDEALEIIAAEVEPLGSEAVRLDAALGRFLAEDLRAEIDLPRFPSSAMDGFALRAGDTPGSLRLIGESAAGAPFHGSLHPGTAIRISTGAVVPPDADAVVPVERAHVAPDRVEVPDAVEAGAHIRPIASDVRAGAFLLAAGTRLGAAQIGAAAAVGLSSVPCRRVPRVAVVGTGSELRRPGETLGDGEIFDSNGPMLDAALRTAGAQVAPIQTVADTAAAHRAALETALEHDVVISSGGVSVGEHDLVRGTGRELGVRELFWRVALRPGKPISFGVRDSTLVFGLPGNPVSALVCFELFVRPALHALQGAPFRPGFRTGRLSANVTRNAERDDLIRVRLAQGAGVDPGPEVPELTPVPGQQSHQIAVTAGADGLARIPAGAGELPAGTLVAYLPLHSF